MDSAEIRRRWLTFFERSGHTVGAVGVADRRRPEPAARQRRHGAVQALLPGRADPAVRAGHQRAEVRADPRHRGGRQDHPARLVLPDGRQLLLRRLLQGDGDPAGVGADDPQRGRRRLRPRRVPALGHRLHRRRRGATTSGPAASGSARTGCSGSGWTPTTGRWACPARAAPARRSSTTSARSTAATAAPRSTTSGSARSGTSCSCSTSAGRAPARTDFPILGELPGEEHRHRPGHGAARRRPAGRRQHLRDRHQRGTSSTARRRSPGVTYGADERSDVGPAGRGRPRPHRRDARRRRGHPRQRGPRLRAAPDPAPHHPHHAAARCRTTGSPPSSSRAAIEAMAPQYPELRERASRHPRGQHRGGGVLPGHAAPGHRDLRRRRAAGPRRRQPALRRRRRSRCTTPTASRSTSPWRWRPSRA